MSSLSLSQILTQLNSDPSTTVDQKLALYRSQVFPIVFEVSRHPPSNDSSWASDLQQFLNHLTHESTGLLLARPLLNDLIQLIVQLSVSSEDAIREILLELVIEILSPRLVSFEEQVSLARERLAEIQEEKEQWTAAARTLMSIPLESGHRSIGQDYKLKTYIHIVRLLLEDDDAVTAETYLNRASFLITPSTDTVMLLTYRMCQARILDAKRRFIDASLKYLELSYATIIDPEEKLAWLKKAVICGVLADAGPQRARLLATLYKDERISQLSSVYFSVLEKMYLGRILREHEVKDFLETLEGHHIAKLSDGSTVFDRAVIQHNLLAASLIYTNISFEELGRLLNISSKNAEQTAAKMISENRLKGCVDQIDGYVDFYTPSTLIAWDQQLASICSDVDELMKSLESVPSAS